MDGSFSESTQLSVLLPTLQSLSEHELGLQVVRPLLEAVRCRRVDMQCGPNERGADILALATDVLGEEYLVAVQLKLLKPLRRADGNRSLKGIMVQLAEASATEFTLSTGQTLRPREVWLCTPFEVPPPALDDLVISFLRDHRVHFKLVDGPRLLALCARFAPHVVALLAGRHGAAPPSLVSDITNRQLAAALRLPSPGRDLRSIATDINIHLGNRTSLGVLGLQFNPAPVRVVMTPEQWDEFTELDSRAQAYFGRSLLAATPSPSLIQAAETAFSKYREYVGEIEGLYATVDEAQLLVRSLDDRLMTLMADDPERHDASLIATQQQRLRALRELFDSIKAGSYQVGARAAPAPHLEFLSGYPSLWPLETGAKVAELVPRIMQRASYLSQWDHSAKQQLKRAQIEVTVDLSPHARRWAEDVRKFREAVAILAGDPTRQTALRDALKQSYSLCTTYLPLAAHSALLACCRIPDADALPKESATRLSIGAQAVMQSGVNVLLLGDAGSGKTTALKLYAAAEDPEVSERLRFFIPLGQIAPRVEEARAAAVAAKTDRPGLLPLRDFFRQQNVPVEAESIHSLLSSGRTTLLLDGLDEAATHAAPVGDWITWLAEEYPNCQLVVSSRIQGQYSELVSFPAVTLMEFTPAQRSEFIERWFRDASVIEGIERHLHDRPALAEVSTSPLLVSVLCMLAESGVMLPETEVQLYRDRMRLLMGDFDREKGIRRLRSRGGLLDGIARRLAFHFHSLEVREMPLTQVRTAAAEWYAGRAPLGQVQLAIDELIDPCNILMPMTGSGSIGFGHLRYQEYLAAEHLVRGHTGMIAPLLQRLWWRDALIMVADLVDDFVGMARSLSERLEPSGWATLRDMIGRRPVYEQGLLSEVRTLIAMSLGEQYEEEP